MAAQWLDNTRRSWRRMRGIFLSRYRHFVRHFRFSLQWMQRIITLLACTMALVALAAMCVYVGFDHSERSTTWIFAGLRAAQVVFAINMVFGWLFDYNRTRGLSHHFVRVIVDAALILSLVPWIYPRPDAPWWPHLAMVLYHKGFLFGVLAAYSVVELSFGLMSMVSRRTNPSLLMAGSFAFFIAIGSLVLMLPKCTYGSISYIDSLFVSTSAVCITGLSSVDLPSTFTPLGLMCIGLLAQIGGLGVLTFTSFFAVFFSGNTSIYNQILIRDLVYSRTINALVPTLLYIIAISLTIELIGAAAVYFTLPDTLGLTLQRKLLVAAFHSMSAFCNAGFSAIPEGMANPVLMAGNGAIYLVTSALVLAGAIGFPILVNFKEWVGTRVRAFIYRLWHGKSLPRKVHIADINTKLVLTTTLWLLGVCTLAFLVLEWNNTLAGMSIYDKVVQAIFNSLTPRSAGFVSVNPASFLPVTLMLVLFQMWIGGASQSLAGGIKVNTFATVLLNLRAIVLGHGGTTAFHRTLAPGSVRRANAVVILSILALLVYCTVIMLLEPDIQPKALVFETVSALFTVGSSLGITAQLSTASKAVLCSAMLLGRVGIISLLCSFAGSVRDSSAHYPTESVIIN